MSSFLIISDLKLRKLFGKTRMVNREIDLELFRFQKNNGKKSRSNTISETFDSISRGKMALILLAYGLPTETVTVIMMLNIKMKAMVHSPDGDWHLWYCCWNLSRRCINTKSIYKLPNLCIMNINRSKERKLSHTKKAKSSQYPTATVMDAENADNIVLLANMNVCCIIWNRQQKSVGFFVNIWKWFQVLKMVSFPYSMTSL